MTKKYFGTDGIRGPVGQFPITPDFALKLGWAAGRVLGKQPGAKVLLGKDTRISGYMFESALEAGLSAAGVDTLLLGPLPTPAVSYLTRTFSGQAGIVISASHNAYTDNGIKFFGPDGKKLDDELEAAIEAELDKEILTVAAEELGRARRINDAAGRYIEFCKSTYLGSRPLTGLRLVIDCAHGAGYQVGPLVFRELGAEVFEIGVKPDGFNINKEVGSTHPKELQEAVLARRADAGIALDGDADRVVLVDENGALIDGDQIMFIILNHLKSLNRFSGGVVGTLMTNLGFEKALDALDVPLVRAKVGDRYVVAEMGERGWQLGGETSGHVICGHATGTGDGVVSALQVISAMVTEGRSLSELTADLTLFPQKMINVRVAGKADLEQSEIVAAVERSERELADRGRVLLRASGTEPVVRVMVEAQDAELAQAQAEAIAEVVRAHC